eukprot:CAMPEP_0176063864 /NCGR_PEP_ID=MMETSP0120_2-20121206/31853_1 /TAXON_ID=160619 /ORGANISM="Kryptoperidinium foliaceum, Strain CCMP 1326" /LENGTH=704 /DNA_ID=CAMNT_0017397439 /DNA_START=30 /DNA_END=2144 /DNA_ORIENTATION=+
MAAAGAGKKPLFEYDDHYVMLNDIGRNEFYRRALARAVPGCGEECTVLDVGAGSGLLSMMAANLGARHVVAIEANPNLASLAERTVVVNQPANFPSSNVTIFAELSSAVSPARLPGGRPADILVTETFGTMLLGEGAANFVPDARDRLLKPGGQVIPVGGCQYVTLVEIPGFIATLSPRSWGGLNLTGFEVLQDSIYWKATMGASRMPFKRLTERICVLELDLWKDTRDSIPLNRTFRVPAAQAGTVHAALFDWDVWADDSRSDIMSNAPGARNFAGDVAWGWLLQVQEEAGEDWRYGPFPKRLVVAEGELVDVAVEFIARGISMHVRSRRAASPGHEPPGPMPQSVGSPARMRGVERADMIEANEFYLPAAGDEERHTFYGAALDAAVERHGGEGSKPTLLDCSSGAGVPALSAAKRHGMQSLVLTRRKEFANVLRTVAKDNGVQDLVESYSADVRDMLELLLPRGERADIVVVEPPGTPLHGLSPFAVLPYINKHLLKEGGIVVPGHACFEIGLVESDNLASMFAVPGGRWAEMDMTVWNEEAVKQGVLGRLVPYTKWFGLQSTMGFKWLATPQCVHEVDLGAYGKAGLPNETVAVHRFHVSAEGRGHALVGKWVVWDTAKKARMLGPDSSYLGRALTWPHYVQALSAPGAAPGVVQPLAVAKGDVLDLEVTTLQAGAKRTAAAGPEFSLRFLSDEPDHGEL